MTIEEQDRRILQLLQTDGRISNQELADKTAMSASVCWRRVRALEQASIIKTYAALIDAKAAGLNFHAITLITLERHQVSNVEDFIHAVTRRPEVLDCFATTGEADYHLRIRCRDIDAYNVFLDTFLFRQPGVSNVRTNVVLKELKHQTAMEV